MMGVSNTGLLLARQYAPRVVLYTLPALQRRALPSFARLYSTSHIPQHDQPPPPPGQFVHKRPPKDLQVARQVVDGVESSKDSVLKAYCMAKIRKSTSKKKEPAADPLNPYSEYDPDNILSPTYFAFIPYTPYRIISILSAFCS